MKKSSNTIKVSYFFIFVFIYLFFTDCSTSKLSVCYNDKNAGFNGSFEFTQNNLPVNWILYTAQTVPKGDFDIITDTVNYIEGEKSLHFVVRKCVSNGGRYSPGLSKELPAKQGETYNISFWIKNIGSEFIVKAGGVTGFGGKLQIIVQSEEQIESWKKFESIYTIPSGMTALRFEVNLLTPGSFWIDNVIITK